MFGDFVIKENTPAVRIGVPVVGGAFNLGLFADSAGKLAQSAGFAVANDGTPSFPWGVGTAGNVRLGAGSGNNTATGGNNFALGASALSALTVGTDNIAVGYQALKAATSGTSNVAIGSQACLSLTTGANNFGLGRLALSSATTTSYNVAVGSEALEQATGTGSVCVGAFAGQFASGDYNSGLGLYALNALTSGTQNVAMGLNAGRFTLATGSYNLLLGAGTDTAAAGTNYGVALGYAAACATSECAFGPYLNVQTGYGVSSTAATRARADVTDSWVDSTDATRKARRVFNVWDTAAREAFRIEAGGASAKVSWFGAAAAGQQTGDVGAALVAFGLMTGTPTSMAIGGAVSGGTAHDILFVDGGGNLGQNSGLIAQDTTHGALVAITVPGATYLTGLIVNVNTGGARFGIDVVCDSSGKEAIIGDSLNHRAAAFYDTTNNLTALLCDGTYAVNITAGDINTAGAYRVGGTAGVTGTTLEGDTVAGGIITAIGVSDGRLKTQQTPLGSVLAPLLTLHPVRHFWDRDLCALAPGVAHNDRPHIGLLAEEVAAAFPEAAQTALAVDGVALASYSVPAMVAVLVAAVQELTARITKLESKP